MKESFDEGHVDRTYEGVGALLDEVEEHMRRCVRLLCNQPDVPPKGPTVSDEGLREVTDGLRRIGDSTEKAKALLVPLHKELPGLATEPVRSQSIRASSWAEAVVMHAENYLREVADWMRFKKLSAMKQNQLVDAVTRDMPNAPEFRARLKIEAAALRRVARDMRPEVRYAYEFQHLEGQSRKLFRYLADNAGRRLEKREIAEAVMDNPDASAGSVHTAISRLRTKLRAFGSEKVAASITEDGGEYRFG